MSKLEELIKEFCPNGVEYVKIKDVFTRLKGTSITAGKMKEIETSYGEIKIFAGGKTVINANESDIPNANITRVPAVLVQSRGVIDFIYYDQPFTFKNEMWAYTAKNIITVKYLYYVLKNNVQYFRESASGMGALPQISLGVTEDFIVPLPALPVQREIVRILDSFTLYSAELTAELTARRKQYEYYRDKLLNFNQQKIEVRKLFEIFEIRNGYTPSKKNKENWINGTIPWFRLEDIRENGRELDDSIQHITSIGVKKSGLFKKGSIILSTTATIGEHAIINRDFLCNQQLTVLTINEEYKDRLMEKFVFYYCYIVGKNCISACNYSGGIPIVDSGKFKNLLFPVPPIDVQERIVKVLDNFDAICSDLGIGLPAEIEKRQKQYEYYREKLLTFDMNPATIFNGTERNGTERNGTERNGTERNGTERNEG